MFQAHCKRIYFTLKQLGLNLILQMGSRRKGEATCLNRAQSESVTLAQNLSISKHQNHAAVPGPSSDIHEPSCGAPVMIFTECQQTFSVMGFKAFKQIHHSSTMNRISILMKLDEAVQKRSRTEIRMYSRLKVKVTEAFTDEKKQEEQLCKTS